MAAVADLDEIKEVNANCILMANLQQASTSGAQTDSAPVYDSDGSAEVHNYANCNDNEIFNMFTQEEQYTELLEPIPESHQVPQNDNDVISEDTSMKQGGETVEQHIANSEEIRALYDSLYHNLAIEVEKVNSEAAKFVGDFKSLANEADASLAKHKALELETERLLIAILSRVHSTFHVSNLKKFLSDEPLAILLDELHIDDKLCFIEEPVENYGPRDQKVKAKPYSNYQGQMELQARS
nr:putative reverse transcriptase domain-containing protein [Tanacetum cinerariifolium]